MRILIYSDLHLEFPDALARFRVPEGLDYDAVVLAGDIHKHTDGLSWAAETFIGKRIIYVAGNHEFYGSQMHVLMAEMRKVSNDIGVIFLENDEWIDQQHHVRFLGTTLWTDFRLFGTESAKAFAMKEAALYMPDFRVIQVATDPSGFMADNSDSLPPRVLQPVDTVRIFNRSKKWLESKLAESFEGPTVVVTHHLPSFSSVAARFQRDPVSAAFATRIDTIVEKADLWIHGHTHDFFDYKLDNCRVICNPRGYPDKFRDTIENKEFQPGLVVDV